MGICTNNFPWHEDHESNNLGKKEALSNTRKYRLLQEQDGLLTMGKEFQ